MPLIILWPIILFFRATCFSLSDFHPKLAVLEPFLVLFGLTDSLSGGKLFKSVFLLHFPCIEGYTVLVFLSCRINTVTDSY